MGTSENGDDRFVEGLDVGDKNGSKGFALNIWTAKIAIEL